MPQSWLLGDADSFVFMFQVKQVSLRVLCRNYTKRGRHLWHSLSMVTAKAQYNLGNAKRYFGEHLSVGDYYQEGQKTGGEWFGRGGETLGLIGQVKADDFLATRTSSLQAASRSGGSA